MIGSDPWMVAATTNVVSSNPHHNPPDGINMAAVFFLVGDGEALKVTQHRVGGPGIAESDDGVDEELVIDRTSGQPPLRHPD